MVIAYEKAMPSSTYRLARYQPGARSLADISATPQPFVASDRNFTNASISSGDNVSP